VKNSSKQIETALGFIQERTKRKVRSAIYGICKEVIMQTPVDTGRLINNWYASNKKPVQLSTKAVDKSGKNSLARVNKALTRLKLGQTFYLSNNLPYAAVVEFGEYPNPPKKPTGKTVNGFSKLAPQGMLRIGLIRGLAKFRASGGK